MTRTARMTADRASVLLASGAAALCACLACTQLPEEETIAQEPLWVRDSLAVRAILDANGRGDLPVPDVIGIDQVAGERRVTGLWLQHVNVPLALPLALAELQALRVLVLDSCGLTDLPLHLFALGSLEELYLKSNGLSGLPPEFRQLRRLGVLEAQFNRLDRLPRELADIPTLSTLILHHNLLADFPVELTEHPILRTQGADMNFNKLCAPLGPVKENWLAIRDPNWRASQVCP